MLPEAERRKLYLQYDMHSIYEFAAKLAGVSREVVNEVLRIHRLLNEMPKLQEKLVNGEVSYTKLRAVACVVRPETENLWLEKVQTMARSTLEVYVRELKRDEQQGVGQQEGEQERDEQQSGILPVRCGLPGKEGDYETLSFRVNRRTAVKMRVLKLKIERKLRKPLDWNETMEEILKLAEGKMQRKAEQKAEQRAGQKTQQETKQETGIANFQPLLNPQRANAETQQPAKRYIPASIRNQVLDKNRGICDYPNCNKPGEIFHHIKRFALNKYHNPEKIKYLCKAHERIAHHSLIQNEENSPETWQLLTEPDKTDPKYSIDSLVQKFRMGTV